VVSSAGCSISTEGFLGSQRDLPWACVVEFPSGISRRYSMYFWTVSHGGRARPVTEYRIQVKLKDRRSLDFGKGTTLLLGYYTRTSDWVGRDLGNHPPVDMEIFVAWDPIHHLALGASSSCQVSYDLMFKAYIEGVGESERRCADGSVETVFAFRPELLPRYLREAAGGHNRVTRTGLQDT